MALPPDVRAARNFRIVKGLDDNIIRTDYTVDSGVTSFAVGEWVVLNASNQAVKATGATEASPAANVACNWTKYVKGDMSTGQSDAATTGGITCISGSYQAETTLFESTGTFTAGFLLVVMEDTVTAGQGVLVAVDSASASNAQLGAVVGRVVGLSNGVLTYKSLGAA